jgi:uncharacterized protein HemY
MAFDLVQEYLVVFRRLRGKGSIPMVLGYLARMAVTLGDFETAVRAAQEKLKIQQSGSLGIDKAYGLHTVGYVNLAQGHLAQARRQLESALALARASQDFGFTADTLHLLGRIAVHENHLDEAAALLEESQRLGRGRDRPRLEEHILFTLGRLACRRNDFARAAVLFRESLDQCQDVRPKIPSCLEGLATVSLGQGRPERAAKLLGAAGRLRATMEAPVLPVDRLEYDGILAALQSAMSDEDFRRAWAVGNSMALQEALATALAEEE